MFSLGTTQYPACKTICMVHVEAHPLGGQSPVSGIDDSPIKKRWWRPYSIISTFGKLENVGEVEAPGTHDGCGAVSNWGFHGVKTLPCTWYSYVPKGQGQRVYKQELCYTRVHWGKNPGEQS